MVTISTVGFKKAKVHVYNSMHPFGSEVVMRQIAALLTTKEREITLKFVHAQKQSGGMTVASSQWDVLASLQISQNMSLDITLHDMQLFRDCLPGWYMVSWLKCFMYLAHPFLYACTSGWLRLLIACAYVARWRNYTPPSRLRKWGRCKNPSLPWLYGFWALYCSWSSRFLVGRSSASHQCLYQECRPSWKVISPQVSRCLWHGAKKRAFPHHHPKSPAQQVSLWDHIITMHPLVLFCSFSLLYMILTCTNSAPRLHHTDSPRAQLLCTLPLCSMNSCEASWLLDGGHLHYMWETAINGFICTVHFGKGWKISGYGGMPHIWRGSRLQPWWMISAISFLPVQWK